MEVLRETEQHTNYQHPKPTLLVAYKLNLKGTIFIDFNNYDFSTVSLGIGLKHKQVYKMSEDWDQYAEGWDTNEDVIVYSKKAFESLTGIVEP